MSPKLKKYFSTELTTANQKLAKGDYVGCCSSLERAHILSQAYAWQHILVHWHMLIVAFKRVDVREILGQIVRLLVAGPGSLLGRAPIGNTGGANVGIFRPMEIPADLRAILLTDDRSRAFIGESAVS